jgi:arabinose-5-phosphate isomerase
MPHLHIEKFKEIEFPKVKNDVSFNFICSNINHTEEKLISVIVEDDKVIALLSDGDLRRAMLKDDFSLNIKVEDIATKNPIMLDDKNLLASDALKIIEDNKIQMLLIVNKEKKLKGVLHIHKLVEAGINN